jgi:two-component system LytT family response regulator
MMWRAYVVDDEPLAVDRLVRLLGQTGRVTLMGSATSPPRARTFLATHEIDLLFLDISMPGMTGFDLLADLPTAPCVVFTTAHDEYALQAFRVTSVDYLLKPIQLNDLQRALDKFERLQGQPRPSIDLQSVRDEILAAVHAPRPEYLSRLASRLGGRVCFLDLASVTHLYAEDKLTYAVADGKAYCVDATLIDLEARLDPRTFVRVHRAALVNAAWVAELRHDAGGAVILTLGDPPGTRLVVARSRIAEVKTRLGL